MAEKIFVLKGIDIKTGKHYDIAYDNNINKLEKFREEIKYPDSNTTMYITDGNMIFNFENGYKFDDLKNIKNIKEAIDIVTMCNKENTIQAFLQKYDNRIEILYNVYVCDEYETKYNELFFMSEINTVENLFDKMSKKLEVFESKIFPELQTKLSFEEWENSNDYWNRLYDNYGVDSETDIENHEITKENIKDLYKDYIKHFEPDLDNNIESEDIEL